MKIARAACVFATLNVALVPSLVMGKAGIDTGCDDDACPIPQPHPPHVRRAAEPAVAPAMDYK
eukprot:scaffold2246_cov162-Amphora_coffeaeformis.AAC.31